MDHEVETLRYRFDDDLRFRLPSDKYFTCVMRNTSNVEWLSSSHQTVANLLDGLSEK